MTKDLRSSELKDLPRVSSVAGDELIGASLPSGLDVALAASQIGGGSFGPFTDGDGNVYSIEYDGDAKTLALRCVDSGGGVTVSLVGPQEAHITVTSADENSVSDLEVDGSSFRMQSYTVEPDQGTSISVAQSGIEISTQVGVDAALPLTINGVAIDPTLPWPGG